MSGDTKLPVRDPHPQWRLFVALTVPAPVREALHEMQRELTSLVPVGEVRWVPPEQYHLTLRFLGDVPSDLVPSLAESLTETCSQIRPFGVRARGIGFFPNARSPRVIWVGVESGENALIEFQRRVEKGLLRHVKGLASETFLAHVTLGRFQKYRDRCARKLGSLPPACRVQVFGEWQVEGAGLFRSEWSPGSARHSLLASCLLVSE